jgi:outer membrane protein TolC
VKTLSLYRNLRLPGLLLCTCLTTGCVSLERWPIFTDSQQEQPDAEAIKVPAIALVEFLTPTTKSFELAIPVEIPTELSVEQAVMLALRNNSDLQVRQLSPVVTGAFEQIERGTFDPELFAEAEYFEEKASETSRSSGEQFSVSGQETTIRAGLRQFLPTGTTLEASVGQQRSTSDRAPEQQTARLELSVTQALLRGFGPAANLATIHQAQLDTRASRHELRGFAEALLADTEIAYWNYVLARQEIAIFEKSLVVVRKQRAEIELSIEVGLLPEVEAAAIKAEEALRAQGLINARSNVEARRLRLLHLISPDPDGHLDRIITTSSEPRIVPQQITNLNERLQLAEQSRPDLNEAHLRLQQNRLETIVTRNGLLPRLDLFITLGKTGFAGAFSDSFRALNEDTYDLSVGMRLSHFFSNRTNRGRNIAAYASRQQANEAVANLRQLVHLDVRLAVNEVERVRQQIDASHATRIFQEQTLNAEQERFAVGATTALQVARAQRDLLQAQISEIDAIVSYRTALVRLYLAEGSLLERRGVNLDDQRA